MASGSFLLRIHGFVKHGTFATRKHFQRPGKALWGWGCLGRLRMNDALGLSQSDTLMDNQGPLKANA
jgi:hypothetical protein